MNREKLRAAVLKRIAQGHWHVLKKAVPKKKCPRGTGEPAVKERVPSCSTKALMSKGIMKACDADHEDEVNNELRVMRDEGVIHCTNKLWWKRAAS